MSSEELLKQASTCLIEATSLDQQGKPNDAWRKYVRGADLLMEYKNSLPDHEESKKRTFDEKINSYITRAELLKSKSNLEVRSMEQRRIVAGSTGHGYETVFMKCLDDTLTEVSIQDAYIAAHHQVINFVRFCELVVRYAKNLRCIRLTTGLKGKPNAEQFSILADSLKTRRITLIVQYHPDLHDREIRFDNGWIVKIGRGLDYFKFPGQYAIGSFDMNLRTCLETTIDIIRLK